LILDPDAAYPSTIEPRLYRHHLIRLKDSLTSWGKDGFFMDIEPNSMTSSVNILMFKTFAGKDSANCPIDISSRHTTSNCNHSRLLSLSYRVVHMSIFG
jgi:hypothetical protein